MVILIGGAEYTGKTLMAQQLLERYQIPYFSMDLLKMGLIRGNSNCGFTSLDSPEKISRQLWPIVKAIVMTSIENRRNIIIEGSYLPHEEAAALAAEYPAEIISFYIIFSEDYIRKNFNSCILGFSSIIEQKPYKGSTDMEVYIEENKKNKELCLMYGNKYIEIQKSYYPEIDIAYQWLDKKIKSLNKR